MNVYGRDQQQPGSSPKQHPINSNTSPGGGTSSSSMKSLTQTPTNSGSRKSLVSVSKFEVSRIPER